MFRALITNPKPLPTVDQLVDTLQHVFVKPDNLPIPNLIHTIWLEKNEFSIDQLNNLISFATHNPQSNIILWIRHDQPNFTKNFAVITNLHVIHIDPIWRGRLGKLESKYQHDLQISNYESATSLLSYVIAKFYGGVYFKLSHVGCRKNLDDLRNNPTPVFVSVVSNALTNNLFLTPPNHICFYLLEEIIFTQQSFTLQNLFSSHKMDFPASKQTNPASFMRDYNSVATGPATITKLLSIWQAQDLTHFDTKTRIPENFPVLDNDEFNQYFNAPVLDQHEPDHDSRIYELTDENMEILLNNRPVVILNFQFTENAIDISLANKIALVLKSNPQVRKILLPDDISREAYQIILTAAINHEGLTHLITSGEKYLTEDDWRDTVNLVYKNKNLVGIDPGICNCSDKTKDELQNALEDNKKHWIKLATEEAYARRQKILSSEYSFLRKIRKNSYQIAETLTESKSPYDCRTLPG